MLKPGDWVRVKRPEEIRPEHLAPNDRAALDEDSCFGIGNSVLKGLSSTGFFEVAQTTSDGVMVRLKGSAYTFLDWMLEPCAADIEDRFERIDETAFFAEMFGG